MFLSFLAPVFACGGFVPVAGSIAASDAQQALFELGADSVTVTYRARYSGNAADFAWVIAVPGAISDVQEGDGDRLDAIEEASAPQAELDPAIGTGGCACAPATKGDANTFDTGDVTVTGHGYAGSFEYTTLEAADADALSSWLSDHGYDTSLIGPAIEEYVADSLDYSFVAVQLRPDLPEAEAVSLTPLAITYGEAADGALHLAFPARLGKSSTTEEVRTELFVLATGYAEISGWNGAENPDGYDMIGPDYVSGEGLYYGKLQSIGGAARTAWPAYSGAYEGQWLTRWDSITYPTTNAVDPVFTDTGEPTEIETLIYLQEEAAFERGDTPAWVLPIGLIGFAWRRRRRR